MKLIDFANKYAKFLWVSPTLIQKAKILHPYQEDLLNNLEENKFTLSTQSRQMGVTTTLLLYCAWALLYKDNISIAYITPKLNQAISGMESLQRIIDVALKDTNLIQQSTNNKKEKRFNNGSKIIGRTITTDAIIGYGLDVCIIDNAAFIDNLEHTLGALIASVASNRGSLHLVSSANELDFYHKLRMDKNNSFYKMEFHYSLNPNFNNEEWINAMKLTMGLDAFLRECEMIPVNKNNINKNPDTKNKIIPIRIDIETLIKIGLRLSELDLNVSDYIRGLIKKDLELSN